MRISTSAETSTRAIIILILIYVLLIVGLIVFSRTLITSIPQANPAARTLAIVVAVALPSILFVVTVLQIVRLVRQRALRRPGAALKARLTVFFILISLLSGVPQGMLAITFINTSMGSWFSTTIWDALKGASRISLDYY